MATMLLLHGIEWLRESKSRISFGQQWHILFLLLFWIRTTSLKLQLQVLLPSTVFDISFCILKFKSPVYAWRKTRVGKHLSSSCSYDWLNTSLFSRSADYKILHVHFISHLISDFEFEFQFIVSFCLFLYCHSRVIWIRFLFENIGIFHVWLWFYHYRLIKTALRLCCRVFLSVF